MWYNINMDLKEKLKDVPTSPGVYTMYSDDGTIIYVGKAKNLLNRLRSYFHKANQTVKVMAMMEKVADFSYIITKSEIDALLTENNLIKKYKPKYNILLKDDKSYPFLRIDLKEKFPQVTLVRSLKEDGAKYFGPYMISVNVSDILDLIHSAFKIRSCRQTLGDKKLRPCLNYHIGKCLAPCTGDVSDEEYRKEISKVISFLRGNDKEAEKILKEKMYRFSAENNFEAALACREKLKVLDKIVRRQITNMPTSKNIDVFAMRSDGMKTAVSLLAIRGGKITGADNTAFESVSEDLSEFVLQFYQKNPPVCDEILVESDDDVLEEAISKLAGRKILLYSPIKGIRRQLVEMAAANASDYLAKYGDKERRIYESTEGAVLQLMSYLDLPKPPKRIECYDISHLSGTHTVSSMVVFENGAPKKAHYRKFKIKTVENIDDFRSMKETLSRRLARLDDVDESFSSLPDLIVIDGGKGQLSFAKEALAESGADIPVISLAKREEEVFYLASEPIVLDKSSKALQLLQRIRDEAHRFAITFNRSLRQKTATNSELKEIEGVGKTRAEELFKHFKTIKRIKEADLVELAKVVPKNVAVKVFEHFHKDVSDGEAKDENDE